MGTTEGWNAITGHTERPAGLAGLSKVPHHRSANADCAECWTHLLSPRLIAVLTPYSPSSHPRALDVDRLCERTDQVYTTSDPSTFASPKLKRPVEKTLRESAAKRRALSWSHGIGCGLPSRCRPTGPKPERSPAGFALPRRAACCRRGSGRYSNLPSKASRAAQTGRGASPPTSSG